MTKPLAIVMSLAIVLLAAVAVFVTYTTFIDRDESESLEQEDEQVQEEEEEEIAEEDEQEAPALFGVEVVGEELDGAVVKREAWIENPTTGDRQSVRLYEPSELGPWPMVVLIPGGTGDGSSFERPNIDGPDDTSDAVLLAAEGFVVVVYSPLGTGDSDGDVNYQGHDDQDGLAAIIQAVADLPSTDPDNIGLASFSYGVTGAAGVLARYPELGVKYWSDWEGPSSREFTTVGCTGRVSNSISPANLDCDDDEVWSEREAAAFAKTLSVDYYWRIQEEDDHVQSTYGHTLEMVNNAVENENMPWVKLNDGDVNATYVAATVPAVGNANHFVAYAMPHIIAMSEMD